MTATASQWIDRMVFILAEQGYAIGVSPIGSAQLATKRVHSLGPFLPCTDFLFIHDCSEETTSASFEELHEEAKTYSEARFRLPRVLRYHIPNTVSVWVSERGFSAETVEFAQRSKLASQLVGGQKNSTFLFDIENRRLVSQGLERTPGRYGATVVTTVNPTNRTYELMTGIFKRLLAD